MALSRSNSSRANACNGRPTIGRVPPDGNRADSSTDWPAPAMWAPPGEGGDDHTGAHAASDRGDRRIAETVPKYHAGPSSYTASPTSGTRLRDTQPCEKRRPREAWRSSERSPANRLSGPHAGRRAGRRSWRSTAPREIRALRHEAGCCRDRRCHGQHRFSSPGVSPERQGAAPQAQRLTNLESTAAADYLRLPAAACQPGSVARHVSRPPRTARSAGCFPAGSPAAARRCPSRIAGVRRRSPGRGRCPDRSVPVRGRPPRPDPG